MYLRLLFRHFVLIFALLACDDLPDESVDTYLGSVEKTASSDTTGAQLSRTSPPTVFKDVIGAVPITVRYGAPSVRGRDIFGKLVPYHTIWRTGANEATTISFTDSVLVNQRVIPPGEYALFSIPDKEKWTWILNADYDQWGAYNYDAELDLLRFTVVPRPLSEPVETMRIVVRNQELLLQWADTEVPFPVSSLPSGE